MPFIQSTGSPARSPCSRHQPSIWVDQLLGVAGQDRPVAVAGCEVRRPHAAAVGRLPPERRRVDRLGHPPPHDGVVEAELRQQLRHLGNVAEHVGQVADLHRTAEAGGPVEAELEVTDHGLARHEELVHEDVPGAHRDASGGGQAAQHRLGLGPDGEVVVDDRHLPVQHEVGVGGVGGHRRQQAVEQVDELHAEGLERPVPLPVPVGVGDDVHGPGHGISLAPASGHLLLGWGRGSIWLRRAAWRIWWSRSARLGALRAASA